MTKVKGKMKQKKQNRPKTRKEMRKEQRKMKKQRRLEYYTNRRKPGKFVLKPPEDDNTTNKEQINKENFKQISKNKQVDNVSNKFIHIEAEKKKQRKLEKEMQKQRSKQLLEANVEEDCNIKRLEKQLQLNKRKSKSVPQSFVSEGLDYLLEVCDSENMKAVVAAEQQLNDANDGFDEDFALMTNQPLKKTNKIKQLNSNDSDNEDNQHEEMNDSDDEDSFSDDDEKIFSESENSEGDGKSDDSTLDDMSENESSDNERVLNRKRKLTQPDSPNKKQRKVLDNISENLVQNTKGDDNDDINNMENKVDDVKKNDTWEDIYGRIRGKDGSIISNNTGKYIPPAIRAKMEDQLSGDKARTEKLNRLKKQLKGLLNRLAEANMHSISTQLEELYMNNSRNDMNDSITTLMLDSLTSNVITPERLLIEHVLLITILHANVGTEVGAHFLQTIVKQFDSLFKTEQDVENKTLDNTVNVIAQLYNFKVFQSQLLYQILNRLADKFDEKSVECLLAVLKNVGFSLRKDDPLALKQLILDLQKRAADVPEEAKENARVKYMLDILLAIKNNNMSKIPNYDTSYSEHLKKLQKNFIRKGNYVTHLNISLNDLLQAEERGKWWIVGSAWSGAKEENSDKTKAMKTEVYSQKLLDLAKQQRMNTDTRKNIFCILMSAEDYLDAFEKLLHLGLKNQQEREIIHIILHCCLQEKAFNRYYALLAQRFCEYDRKYQMAIKFSVWDKLKTLTDCRASQISNLAKLLTHLFLARRLPISTLKIMKFTELDKVMLRFTRQILLGVLLCDDTEDCISVFQKVAKSSELKMFRESLKLFIRHFLLKNLPSGSIPEHQKNLLITRASIVDKML